MSARESLLGLLPNYIGSHRPDPRFPTDDSLPLRHNFSTVPKYRLSVAAMNEHLLSTRDGESHVIVHVVLTSAKPGTDSYPPQEHDEEPPFQAAELFANIRLDHIIDTRRVLRTQAPRTRTRRTRIVRRSAAAKAAGGSPKSGTSDGDGEPEPGPSRPPARAAPDPELLAFVDDLAVLAADEYLLRSARTPDRESSSAASDDEEDGL